ncbi:ABC transporter ATP-binding protein [Alphaproteobacteria bacterium]|jgi:oligopeptide/dipeptide ABC transporter ATP-binding protein|nr:ABC transporter ATP-binding protein [Alphaproteobacteria bacterium]MDC3286732.1 ABC transporter ATP-binding protein [Alphaproteobacteria bacterium]
MKPVIELRSVERSFVTEPDFADRVASIFGAKSNAKTLRAVDGIDLTIGQGEVVGLVGESGCGKSTLGRIVAGILPQDKGDVLFNGRALVDKNKLKNGSGLGIQMIFQNPASALDPRQKIIDAIAEAPLAHGLVHRSEAREFALRALKSVGLGEDALERFPHEFSGGQRQRICIARALAVDPRVVVCDEAVASLDVSIQAQIINLFLDLKQELNLSYLFISHDISVVEHVADRIAVMYLGQIVEIGETKELLENPQHPYTKALLAEVPTLDTTLSEEHALKGELPSLLTPPSGCRFHTRCPVATSACSSQRPTLEPWKGDHQVRCHQI